MIVYRLKDGEKEFRRQAHIPTGFSVFWLRNFSLIRRITIRPECVEMTVTDNGTIVALSSVAWWVRSPDSKRFYKSMQIANYGFGDQGVRNDGIFSEGDATAYFGEYFQNPNKIEVRVFKTMNDLKTWELVYKYEPGEIRHIHAIQKDPYSDKIWICTGDVDEECSIGWTDNDFESINIIGQGSQLWRVCQLIFTPESVYWGTDNEELDIAGIYKWDRKTSDLQKLYELDGAIFYGITLAEGTIVMSSDREGMVSERDDKTRLFVVTGEDEIEETVCGTWNHNKPGFWFKFAKLRFQRDSGAPYLAISVLNQKELPDGDLIIIHEDELLSSD